MIQKHPLTRVIKAVSCKSAKVCCADEDDAGEVVRGEAVARAAEGLDDIGVVDGLELAAEGADAGEMMSLDISSAP